MAQARVVVAGGGFGGLSTALALARRGNEVVLLERDVVCDAASADDAFRTERPGATQVHQTHGFLARIVVLMREHFPDLLEALRGSGCSTMSGTAALGDPEPGDEDLAILLVRRSTFEWLLRRAVEEEPGIEVRTGVGVAGLLPGRRSDGRPSVAGVVLDDGAEVTAELVVAATGRRGDLSSWLEPLGVAVPEAIRESGLVYLTRWYRSADTVATPPAPKLGGDIGYLKYLIVPGDGCMLSATLAVRAEDKELRRLLTEPARFERACRLLPGPDQWFAELDPEPVGGVRPMGGLLNRIRRFTDADGSPSVLNFHAVGDSHTVTNPLYGRGCSLALLQATLLADALSHEDPLERGRAYEAACQDQVSPWWRHAVELDRSGADPARDDAPDEAHGGRLRAVLEAGTTDPIIGRAMARLWNLLTLPADLDADPAFVDRAATIMADPTNYPTPDRAGPARERLVGAITTA